MIIKPISKQAQQNALIIKPINRVEAIMRKLDNKSVVRKINTSRKKDAIDNEIYRIVISFDNVIRGRIHSFKATYPMIDNIDICSELTNDVIVKIIAGIRNRTIQLFKMSDRQLNVMIQTITTNTVIDYVRTNEFRVAGNCSCDYEDMAQNQQEEQPNKRGTEYRSTNDVVAHEYESSCLLFDIEAYSEIKEMDRIIVETLSEYNDDSLKLYRQLMNPKFCRKTNNPKIVALKKEIIEILRYNGFNPPTERK